MHYEVGSRPFWNSFVSSDIYMLSFAELGQGLVLCTAGNLVTSPSECPSTDLCPSPNNSTVHCSLGDRLKNVINLSDNLW
jgi:hypothetical protein